MPFTRSRELTLRIDRIACEGHGACAELLPELLSLDEWGYPIVHSATVPAELSAHAKRAVAACPVLALRMDRPTR
ncbi:ferredoxin [Streptacidiphilus fuscans]|uniref:Ferredoxin n=1 Tax=Streptacidiphilus fuscans TaxID=2789292 RepID=A0A931B195_9ACTN|nr:ferredoxin [Streptacidiphilus fuscans]MBF9069325.1 ferredoxin [Streptacidiphilus fuscans]